MKFPAVTFMAALAAASPANIVTARNELALRQAAEACNIGYCTQGEGTTGGAGGSSVTVKTVDELVAAAKKEGPLTIVISGAISGSAKVRVSSDKTIIGEKGSSLNNVGLYVRQVKNVIIRNLKIGGVKASNGDAIGIDESTNVWVDHCDLSGDLSGGKDDLDGLLDISHGADWITVSNVYFHDHWKGSLVGHSDSNGSEDKGKLHVTYANNHWTNINSRTPLVRFGTVHVVNSYYDKLLLTGINSRMGAQVLVQSTAFNSCPAEAIFFADSKETGHAVAEDVDLGGSKNSVPKGTLTSASLPYKIAALGSGNVAGSVPGAAGQKL
ncbi:pectate lyase B [Colletotrichum costaricense]|uniref:pectate lyase n=1 Tax=Colletotrichum costaricense TaxID=1209916 RepID=A0AAI9YVR9_9PEZI|nr:pectate lyase B [Colletotrichum costaricense]KAK1525690.1 pectate lyase B [Colletotrichum costaricense]